MKELTYLVNSESITRLCRDSWDLGGDIDNKKDLMTHTIDI
jgi:hypothetical protein